MFTFKYLLILVRHPDSAVTPIKNDKKLCNPSLSPESIVIAADSQHRQALAFILALTSLVKQGMAGNTNLSAVSLLDNEVRKGLIAWVKVICPIRTPLCIGYLAPIQVGNFSADGTAASACIPDYVELVLPECRVFISGTNALSFGDI